MSTIRFGCVCPEGPDYDIHQPKCDWYDPLNEPMEEPMAETAAKTETTLTKAEDVGEAALACILEEYVDKKEEEAIGDIARRYVSKHSLKWDEQLVIERELATLLLVPSIDLDVLCDCGQKVPANGGPIQHGSRVGGGKPCKLWNHAGWKAVDWEWDPDDRVLYWVRDQAPPKKPGERRPTDIKKSSSAPTPKVPPKDWKGYCSHGQNLMCRDCEVVRKIAADKWEWWPPGTSDPYGGTGGAGGSWMSKCRHYGETVVLPNGIKINCSSHHGSWSVPKEKEKSIPHYGLYACGSWDPPTWIGTLVPWTDHGLPKGDWDLVAREIVRHYNLAVDGYVVELGCMGGHGRTGAMLACMAVLAGMKPEKTVAWVHKQYCKEAIECKEQEWFPIWFHAWLNQLPLPEPPPKPKPAPKKDDKKTVSKIGFQPAGKKEAAKKEEGQPKRSGTVSAMGSTVISAAVKAASKVEETIEEAIAHYGGWY